MSFSTKLRGACVQDVAERKGSLSVSRLIIVTRQVRYVGSYVEFVTNWSDITEITQTHFCAWRSI